MEAQFRAEGRLPKMIDFINYARHALALMTGIVVVAGLLYWFILHPFAAQWRRIGPLQTYLIVGSLMMLTGVAVYRKQSLFLGADLGTNWLLLAVGAVLYVPCWKLTIHVRKHLTFRILAGVPEISGEQGRLIQEGIYAVIRHPRYVSAGLGVLANALIANYSGLYLLLVPTFLAGYWMVLLEERELKVRFGAPYQDYQKRVPRFLPKALASRRRT